MKISVIPAVELTRDLCETWRELQGSNIDLASPYFCPEFTVSVAAVRDDVEVAVIEENGKVAAIFPFQRRRDSVGVPVGGILSDFQGLVCLPTFEFDPTELVRCCKLLAWDFDHLIANQKCFAGFHRFQTRSPVIDLSDGFGAYLNAIPKDPELARRRRKLEREIGPLRFVSHIIDEKVFEVFRALKSAQYQRTRNTDILSAEWIRSLIHRIYTLQTNNFSGMLAALYAGDNLVAVNMGMRSRNIWHPWFPAYEPAFSKYSPGIILFLKMAEAAPNLGIQALDLGKGEHYYKSRLSNREIAIAEGSVEISPVLKLVRRSKLIFRQAVKRTPLAPLIRYFRQTQRR